MPDLKNLFACTRLKDRARSRGVRKRECYESAIRKDNERFIGRIGMDEKKERRKKNAWKIMRD